MFRASRYAVLLAAGLAMSGPALAATASAKHDAKPAARAASKPAANSAEWADLSKLPDWTKGVWQVDWGSLFAPGGRPTPPSLTPEYAAKLKAFQAGQARGENVQADVANCLPAGMPQIMAMPYPMEFIYSPGRVTIAIETDSQVRRIYTDGRKHPADPDLTFNGDSIGHWEGSTLVVDTVGLEPHTLIAPGVGHSDQVHLTERIRQTGPDKLEIATTIEDPKVLTKPWTSIKPYIRHADWTIQEYVCEQNNHDSADEKGRSGFRLDNEPPANPPAAPAH